MCLSRIQACKLKKLIFTSHRQLDIASKKTFQRHSFFLSTPVFSLMFFSLLYFFMCLFYTFCTALCRNVFLGHEECNVPRASSRREPSSVCLFFFFGSAACYILCLLFLDKDAVSVGGF